MKTKIISILSIIFSSLLTAIPVFAECSADVCKGNYPESVKAACGCTSSGSDALPTVITAILNSIIGVAGLVAVIYIIIGGINYMTSAGDTSKLEKAKKTILYAVIGLVICVFAFGIVNWVISTLS